jgi:Delta24-sterol reductase
MERHDAAVAIIAVNIREFFDRQQPFRIYHGSTNSTRQSMYRQDNIVDTSTLMNILRVDKEKKTVLVEPNVPMDKLVEETIQHELVPLVVMEFPGITVGGGFSGTSGESSSFRYGSFDRTVNWIEMVIPNGEKVTASATNRADLFWGTASACGTLGVVTLLEVQLMEAKKYVQLTYHLASSIQEAIQKIEEATDDISNDYLDGIIFAKDQIVICSGRLTNSLPEGASINRFTRAQDPWFYIHAERKIRDPIELVDYVPLVDYLFRYDRGAFWVGKYSFAYFIAPFNRVTRYLLDGFLRARVMYHAFHQSGLSKEYIVQDAGVPYQASDEFLTWLHDNFGFYPLWLCPLRQRQLTDTPFDLLDGKDEYLLNFGVWGPGPKRHREIVERNRKLERKVQELRGKKCLYAHTFYPEEEFWSIYDRKTYDALRERYHATHLPTVYEKVKVDLDAEEQVIRTSRKAWLGALFWSIWPLSGLYGVLKAWMGGDYLIQKGKSQKKI